jgi:hypothetical protein
MQNLLVALLALLTGPVRPDPTPIPIRTDDQRIKPHER